MRQWWSEYEKTGKVPSGKCRRNPKYDESARRRAADYYIDHGKSLSRTMRAPGYPKSKEMNLIYPDSIDSFYAAFERLFSLGQLAPSNSAGLR